MHQMWQWIVVFITIIVVALGAFIGWVLHMESRDEKGRAAS